MKILHVNGASAGGGLEQYLAQLFGELDKRGHTNLFLYGEKATVTQLTLKAKEFYIKNIASFNCDNSKSKLKEVQEILDVENPDLVYVHQVLNLPLLEFLTLTKPSVRFVHGFKLVCPEGKKTLQTKNSICQFPLSYSCQIHAYQYRCMPRNPLLGIRIINHFKKIAKIHQSRSYMVVPSGFMQTLLIYNGFDINKITINPYFTYLPKTANVANTPSRPSILALGRITPAKGMDYLIRALSRVNQEFDITIIGDGPALNELKGLAEKLGLYPRVSFPGWLPHEELKSFYQRCSIVAVPSICLESFGIVGIEAMAFQKPVVAFDSGGISEWLKDGETGFLVRPGDEEALHDKISFLIDRPHLAQQMGKRGMHLVRKRFLPEIHLKNLIALFEQAIDSFRKSR